MDYTKQLAAWRKRREKMQRLLMAGKSYAEIGRKFTPVISRQRVREILKVIK